MSEATLKPTNGPAPNRTEIDEPGRPGGPNLNPQESRVIAANIDFYRKNAIQYDRYETYLFDAALQGSLERDLDRIAAYFAPLGRAPSCLECGGGTGNLTLKMCARGWRVTVVDISEDMLDLLRKKSCAMARGPELVCGSIERFLHEAQEKYDVIAFSSVLHHLYSYLDVVQHSLACVRPGGFFYSNYDPVQPARPLLTRALDSLDIAIAKLWFDPNDVLPGIQRRLRKLLSAKDASLGRKIVSAGDIAEYHAKAGLDDEEILRILRRSGFAIVEHSRFTTGRTTPIRFLNSHFPLLQSFKILARSREESP